MPRVASALPGRLHLPSGREVRLAEDAGAALPPRDPVLFADALALFAGPIRIGDARTGERVEPAALPLADFHVLRMIAARAGRLDEAAVSVACDNCDERFEVRPSAAVEVGPWVDGELDDPELDAPFDFGAAHEVPPIATASGRATTVRLAPRTVEESWALLAALARPEVRVTRAVAVAMGVVAIGDERRAPAIARALARASDDAWDAVLELHDRAHYSDRLAAVVGCPSCGAHATVPAPALRETSGEPPRGPEPRGPEPREQEHERDDGFPDLDGFEARVRAIAADVWERRALGDVALEIEAGPAEVDDGGVPLLGCFEPEGVDPATGVLRPTAIRLFYRTFRAVHRDEGPYDLDAEIRETIEHEVDHQTAHLAGHDPVDDEERALIERERERLVGRRELSRRARAGFAASLVDFFRRTWPLWVLALAATWLALRAGR